MEVSDSTRGTKKNSRERGKALADARESGTRSSVADQNRERNESRVNRTRTSVMPQKRAKTAKKTEKKENPKAIVEEEEEYAPTASDGEEDEDEEDLDGEEGDEDVLMVRALVDGAGEDVIGRRDARVDVRRLGKSDTRAETDERNFIRSNP